jgi:hypothetical protein
MTAATPGQVTVNSKEEVFAWFKAANYRDCRINAFPKYTGYDSINRQPANFIFIDYDLAKFNYDVKKMDKAVKQTLQKIKDVFGEEGVAYTILWSGGGYHLLLPLSGNIVLEDYDVFSEFAEWWRIHEFKDMTSVFMQFAEDFLTNNKSDSGHRPTTKSCLLRLPFTFNTKYDDEFAKEVRIVESSYDIEEGDSSKSNNVAAIQYILQDFRYYLFDHQKQLKLSSAATTTTTDRRRQNKEIDPNTKHSQILNSMWHKARRMNMVVNKKKLLELEEEEKRKQLCNNNTTNSNNVSIWVEQLLSVGIPDFRKRATSLILAPYLLHKKRLPYDQAASIMIDWLTNKCNSIEPLKFKPERKVREALAQAQQSGGIHHMSYKTLQEINPEIYQILEQQQKNMVGR